MHVQKRNWRLHMASFIPRPCISCSLTWVPMYRRRDLGGATGVGDEASIRLVPMCHLEVINTIS